jgi:gamma-glutamylcyclotransferase (GGCT)/AIG2-like uncharacterized protein YtfP
MAETLAGSAELLFSYGTLQSEPAQLAIFGRRLQGTLDRLIGYRLEWLEISDPAVVTISGASHHPIVAFTGLAADQVRGTLFCVSDKELRDVDAYEVADYRRERRTLASGRKAWVYVEARDRSVA